DHLDLHSFPTRRSSDLDERKKDVTVVLNPPFVHIPNVKRLVGETADVFVGAQNCSSKESGAYTGEVSAKILASFGVTHVIIGHRSEEHTSELQSRENLV